MSVGIRAEFVKENIMRLLRNLKLGVSHAGSHRGSPHAPKALWPTREGSAKITGTFTVSLHAAVRLKLLRKRRHSD